MDLIDDDDFFFVFFSGLLSEIFQKQIKICFFLTRNMSSRTIEKIRINFWRYTKKKKNFHADVQIEEIRFLLKETLSVNAKGSLMCNV